MTRYLHLLCLLSCLSLFGCDSGSATQEKRKAKGYTPGGGSIQHNFEVKNVAQEKIWEQAAKQAVQRFQLKHGRNPNDLDELIDQTDPPLKELPSNLEYQYDSNTGNVQLAKVD